MNRFGELLRYYRLQCLDAERGRPLTQERLGELLGRILGDRGYTGAAVSEWERGKSHVSHDQRRVLVGLVRVLYECGGLQTPTEADTLLEAGEYRRLNEEERRQVFPGFGGEYRPENDRPRPIGLWRLILIWLAELMTRPGEYLRELRAGAGEGATTDWTDALLALLGWPTRAWTGAQVQRGLAWIAVWLLNWLLTFPFLHWPLADADRARQVIAAYAAGALLIPFFIGRLTSTHADLFWQHRAPDVSNQRVRFYTHQGAYVGYHVGYGLILGLALTGYYLGLEALPRWLSMLVAMGPLLLGHAAARQVPFNLWRAYGTLRFTRSDLGSTMAFTLFGPLLAWFVLMFHPWMQHRVWGAALFLTALLLMMIQFLRRARAAPPDSPSAHSPRHV